MTSRSNPVEIPGWTHIYSGKVRDLYVPNEERFDATGLTVNDDAELRAGSVMVVASDRISAFDRILPTEIPDKGKILTMICRSLNMFPVECIVRGYLTGSGLAVYNETGEIAGVKLPAGLVDGSRLDTPIFTPTGKAEVGEHDELVTREELYAEVGQPVGERLEELSLSLYTTAEKIAREQGIILADTKMEFGTDSYRGEITLGDEVLTPDSSRFWDATQYEPGRAQPSFDKQYVRDWLRSPEAGWDGSDNVPHLPEEIVEKTRARYVEAYERLTGTKF